MTTEKDRTKRLRLTLLDEEVNCDVHFVIGPEKKTIKAHKLFLAEVSPVFEAIFVGPMKSQADSIEEPDTSPKSFKPC